MKMPLRRFLFEGFLFIRIELDQEKFFQEDNFSSYDSSEVTIEL